jgi:hypothetical protein
MRFPRHARMSVTRRGEKELRLREFVARGLSEMAGVETAAGPPGVSRAIAAIARSVESPVVRAIGARAAEIASADGTVRLILAMRDGLEASGAMAAMGAVALACDVRLARNSRLIEAHEQLTIGARIAWTGDTMRRDPAISDAYECFVEDCPEIAAAAAATFERLWHDCVPLARAAGAQQSTGGPARRLAATLAAGPDPACAQRGTPGTIAVRDGRRS